MVSKTITYMVVGGLVVGGIGFIASEILTRPWLSALIGVGVGAGAGYILSKK